ncbi:MAG: pyrroline-5-carboxylate reductase [Deltaproteobacteria bacterium]|nr:pyrroline-5-carboxylate reductase [Deltaproteobacteria bacterium]
MERIAIIGTGNMGTAFLAGLVGSGYPKGRVTATDVRPERLAEVRAKYGVRVGRDNVAAVHAASTVVLAVKPQVMRATLEAIAPATTHRPLVISFAAGVPLAAIEQLLAPGTPVIRAMPNLPAEVGGGATAVAPGRRAGRGAVRRARTLLERVGVVVEVAEDQMDAVTGLSGTGPMYVFIIIEALADAGVRVGLHRETAMKLALQTVLGAAELVRRSGRHPIYLKDLVTSPGGTAIAALHSLERTGMRAVLMDAVQAATERSAELGKIISQRMNDAKP